MQISQSALPAHQTTAPSDSPPSARLSALERIKLLYRAGRGLRRNPFPAPAVSMERCRIREPAFFLPVFRRWAPPASVQLSQAREPGVLPQRSRRRELSLRVRHQAAPLPSRPYLRSLKSITLDHVSSPVKTPKSVTLDILCHCAQRQHASQNLNVREAKAPASA